jgi:hypothetical protein
MLFISYEYQVQNADVKVSRVLPQASWIESNVETMSKTDALLTAAKDRKIAFHEERTARPQNDSYHNSLPGTDALPAAAKDQKIASHKKTKKQPPNNSHHSSLSGTAPGTDALHNSLPGTDALPAAAQDKKTASHKKTKKKQPQNNPQHSSLPGTDTLPAAAKDQKTASHKKTKKQPRNKSSSYTNPGYLSPSDDGISSIQERDYGMCDKDCGWCGRCILGVDLDKYFF